MGKTLSLFPFTLNDVKVDIRPKESGSTVSLFWSKAMDLREDSRPRHGGSTSSSLPMRSIHKSGDSQNVCDIEVRLFAHADKCFIFGNGPFPSSVRWLRAMSKLEEKGKEDGGKGRVREREEREEVCRYLGNEKDCRTPTYI